MTLSPGTRLGSYEILSLIGAGGMGEVYRAIDTRLRRTVAIKIILARAQERPDARARFKVEAQAIAALGHPNICQIFDVGEHGDVDFLVMEYVEGETLAARLANGPLKLADALRYAWEMSDALGHAHRRGIIHRDVKPANAIITSGGLKLLDFGLARLQPRHENVPIPESTIAPGGTRLTQTGTTLGTWQYMAPEQIRSGHTDARSDVFALGIVIYEMVTGRRPFEGATHHDLLTAILSVDPPAMSTIDPSVSAAVDQVARACLAKDPDDRWQSAGEVRRALDTLLAVDSHPRPSIPTRTRTWRVGAIVALVIASLVGVLMLWPRPTGSAPARVIRSTLALAPEVSASAGAGAVAFSPDGSSIVYVGSKAGRSQLYHRRLAESIDTPISGSEGGDMPFFSPDGKWLGFWAHSHLAKIPIEGGRPTVICDMQSLFGASWSEDGSIVFSHLPETGLFRVSASGGTPEPITMLAPEDVGNDHRYPQTLPGGRAVVYAVATGPEETARIVVADLGTGSRKELLRGIAAARFVPPDQVVYARNGELFAAPFSVDRLELTGPSRQIAAGVAESTDGAPEYSVSASGHLVYVPGVSGGRKARLVFVDLLGHVSPIGSPPAYIAAPRVSPDGRYIAFYVGAAKNNVWLFDIERGTTTRVTAGRFHEPVWMPDGRLTAAEGGPGSHRLVTLSADGSGARDELVAKGPSQFPESWSPDGRTLAYRMIQPNGQWDLWSVTADDKRSRPLLTSPSNERNARYSPNGRWMAYTSDETGRAEIYVRSVHDTGGRWPISTEGGRNATWAPDGRRLFYRGSGGMWAVDVGGEPRFTAGRPELLFPTPGVDVAFDIMPDGKRFVMVQLDTRPPATELQLVLNLFAPSRPARTQ